tara:strand:- start:240 stop:1193 length:954 start_codon:yes stop_codon:yes gene_type:complete
MRFLHLFALLVFTVTAIIFRLFVENGPEGVGFGWPNDSDGILFHLRGGALISGLLAGSSLSISGLLLQGTLRNELASPWILGSSAGAALFVAIGMIIKIPFWLITPVAALGSIGSLILVLIIAKRCPGGVSGVILSGIIVSIFLSAVLQALSYLLPPESRSDLMQWSMGSVKELPNLEVVFISLVVLFGSFCFVWCKSHALDVSMLSDEEAVSMGVNANRLRKQMICLAGVLTACSVAICGPIAFIGLLAPHLARVLFGSHHRSLLVGSLFLGGSFLVIADSLRFFVDFGYGSWPVGVITGLIGSPCFLFLLIVRRS